MHYRIPYMVLSLTDLGPQAEGTDNMEDSVWGTTLAVRIGGTLEDIDPLNKVPLKRAISRVKKGPL